MPFMTSQKRADFRNFAVAESLFVEKQVFIFSAIINSLTFCLLLRLCDITRGYQGFNTQSEKQERARKVKEGSSSFPGVH